MTKIIILTAILLLFSLIHCEYDEKQATDFYNYCRLSYCPYEEIINLNKCGPACEIFKTYMLDLTIVVDDPNHIMAYLFYNKNDQHLNVVYRGTQGNLNWMNNFDAKKVDYEQCPKCKVHEGFYKYHKIIVEKIKEPLMKLQEKYGTKKLYVTGHSLGGALATLGCIELAKYNDLEKVITFGSPRVGNKEFAQWWESYDLVKEKYRIVQHQDIVPHVPMINLGFQHVGIEIWYYENESLNHKFCPTLDDPKCSDSVKFLRPYDHARYYAMDSTKDPNFGHCCGFGEVNNTLANSFIQYQLKQ